MNNTWIDLFSVVFTLKVPDKSVDFALSISHFDKKPAKESLLLWVKQSFAC